MGHDSYIRYMERTRNYYLALGYDNPYAWAHHDDVPFTVPNRPVTSATVALITTAALFRPEFGDQGPGAPYNGAAKFFTVYAAPTAGDPDVRISHIAYDRTHSRADDIDAHFPLARLKEAVAAGRVGALAERFIGLPTDRSQTKTVEIYAPDVLALCRADGVDAAVLVANCPVCHQSVSLAARYLEQHGIATVVLGCARDIVESCGVPRFVFSDFPLGNAAGKPHDVTSQRDTLSLALALLDTATGPRTTRVNPQTWAADEDWKQDYCNVDRLTPDERTRLRAGFDMQKAAARANR